MWTFKAYLKKEIIEAIRQYKYLMLAIGVVAFAILDPIILKLLPNLLKGSLPKEVLDSFIGTQTLVLQSYIKNLNQIGLLFIVFIISGTLCEEIHSQKLVFPYSKGANPLSIVVAKFINFTISVTLLVFIGFLTNYYYASILFPDSPIELSKALIAGVAVGIYIVFNISLTMFLSTIFKKTIVVGITTLLISFASSSLTKISIIKKFIPYNLIDHAYQFTLGDSTVTILTVAGISLILIALTVIRMNKVEVI